MGYIPRSTDPVPPWKPGTRLRCNNPGVGDTALLVCERAEGFDPPFWEYGWESG